MCGIVGYIGNRKVVPFLIEGLERLEYRGYDSAGLAFFEQGQAKIYKKKGKVAILKKLVGQQEAHHTAGIAHTRWATHGEANDVNSHPHASNNGQIILVHNGIMENYLTCRQVLEGKGYVFHSKTDTEVICNLIEEIKKTRVSTLEAVREALAQVQGTYGLAILNLAEPDKLIVARKGSPIVVGVGQEEFFVASDAAPIAGYTDQVFYLNDGDVALLDRNGSYLVSNLEKGEISPSLQKLKLDLEIVAKNGFKHFMLKEIFEQPKAITDSLRGRLNLETQSVLFKELKGVEKYLKNANRIIFVACGTSWHAALTAEYYLEELAGINVEVEYASEFRYRDPLIGKGDVVIAISQSGETADTLAAVRIAKDKGALVLSVCNVPDSSIPRETKAVIYTQAGYEMGVASTKAFTTQLSVLLLLALRLGDLNGHLGKDKFQSLLKELASIPNLIEEVLGQSKLIFKLANSLKKNEHLFYLGRGYGFPTALEGALKLKEISYLHAEGYPAAEMKHGPISLIEPGTPAIFVALDGPLLSKILSNIEEVRARGGRIIALTTKGLNQLKTLTEEIVEVPKVSDLFTPFLASVVLQLLAYQVAVLRGSDVDKPRNLAKSVTVE